jgi:hypothetical protein
VTASPTGAVAIVRARARVNCAARHTTPVPSGQADASHCSVLMLIRGRRYLWTRDGQRSTSSMGPRTPGCGEGSDHALAQAFKEPMKLRVAVAFDA